MLNNWQKIIKSKLTLVTLQAISENQDLGKEILTGNWKTLFLAFSSLSVFLFHASRKVEPVISVKSSKTRIYFLIQFTYPLKRSHALVAWVGGKQRGLWSSRICHLSKRLSYIRNYKRLCVWFNSRLTSFSCTLSFSSQERSPYSYTIYVGLSIDSFCKSSSSPFVVLWMSLEEE